MKALLGLIVLGSQLGFGTAVKAQEVVDVEGCMRAIVMVGNKVGSMPQDTSVLLDDANNLPFAIKYEAGSEDYDGKYFVQWANYLDLSCGSNLAFVSYEVNSYTTNMVSLRRGEAFAFCSSTTDLDEQQLCQSFADSR